MTTMTGPLVQSSASTAEIPVLTTHDPIGLRVIYSLAVPNLQPSSIVHLKVQAEFSNGAVSLDWALLRTDSADSVTGTYLKSPVSMTFMPEQHHYVIELWAFDSEMPAGNYYYNLIASAKSKDATPGMTVIVQEGYGDMTALVYNT